VVVVLFVAIVSSLLFTVILCVVVGLAVKDPLLMIGRLSLIGKSALSDRHRLLEFPPLTGFFPSLRSLLLETGIQSSLGAPGDCPSCSTAGSMVDNGVEGMESNFLVPLIAFDVAASRIVCSTAILAKSAWNGAGPSLAS